MLIFVHLNSKNILVGSVNWILNSWRSEFRKRALAHEHSKAAEEIYGAAVYTTR